MKRLALTLALLLALAACGEDDLQGSVASKTVHPGYMWTYMQPMYSTSCSGKPAVCSSTISGYIPIIYWVPTCYEITVKGETSGETCLDETAWEQIQVGDEYEGPDVDPKDRKQKRGEGEAS